MPAVVPYLATAGMIITAAAVKSAWAQIFAYVVIGVVANELSEELQPDEFTAPKGVQLQQNVCQSGISLPLFYGEGRIGGDDVFMGVTGTNNETLWIVQALAEGECNGIKKNGVNDIVFVEDTLLVGSTYASYTSYTFYPGSRTQTYNEEMFNAFPQGTFVWGDYPEVTIDKDDNYRNTCYIVWKFTYNQEVFHSVPKRNVILEGRKVWLPDGTKGYSQNAAAILYDYLRSPHCAFGLGGVNDQLQADEIDYFSYLSAYNYCDQSSKGWEFNGAIFHEETVRGAIDRIKKHFRGTLRWTDGKFYIGYRDMNEEVSMMDLTDDHIARDENGKAMISMSQQGRATSFDGLRISFINTRNNKYIEDFIMVGETEGIIKEIDLTGYLSRTLAGAMGAYIYDRASDPYDRIISGTFRDDAVQLNIDNLVTLTSTALGYSSQYMRVIGITRRSDGLINLDLQLEHINLYNDTYDDVGNEGYFSYDLPTSKDFNPAHAPEVILELDDDDFNSVFEYDLDIKDLNKTIVVTSENDVTVNLPSVGEDNIGAWAKFIHYGTGKLTVQAADSDTIDTSSAGGNVYHDDVRDA